MNKYVGREHGGWIIILKQAFFVASFSAAFSIAAVPAAVSSVKISWWVCKRARRQEARGNEGEMKGESQRTMINSGCGSGGTNMRRKEPQRKKVGWVQKDEEVAGDSNT